MTVSCEKKIREKMWKFIEILNILYNSINCELRLVSLPYYYWGNIHVFEPKLFVLLIWEGQSSNLET